MQSIEDDISWLGFEPNSVFYASDYYQPIYECAGAADPRRQGLRR